MVFAGADKARALTGSSFVFTLQQENVGGIDEVVGTGIGTINTSNLTSGGSDDTAFAYINAFHANVAMGSTAVTTGSEYQNYVIGPTTAGSGSLINATSSSGDIVAIDGGIFGNQAAILVPLNYVSGSALSDSAIWSNQTYSSLGLDSGVYEWTWGGGLDTFTLDVIPVPEPSHYGMLIVLAFAGLTGWRRFLRSSV